MLEFFSSILSGCILSVYAEIDTADDDTADTCELLDASCDHEGFTIVFDTACAADKYKAVQYDELFASGPTQVTSQAVFDQTASGAGHNSECVFDSTANADGNYEMKFNYKQCGTTHEASDSDALELEYYNAVQGLEYYSEVVLGVKVYFQITCTASREATITEKPVDILGDQDFDAADMEDRPTDWAQNVLTMSFYTDSGFSTAMDASNQVPLGEDVHVQIVTNVANEEINTRIDRCWVTPDNNSANAIFFDLYKTDCSWTDLNWVTLDPVTNGASPTTSISFQSLRFPGAYAASTDSFWLHCDTYMCYSDATDGEDCTWIKADECAAGRRRRSAFENVIFKRSAEGSGDVTRQENGIVAADTLSAEVVTTLDSPYLVTEDGIEINKVRKVTGNLDAAMKRMAKNFKQARNRVRNLHKLIAPTQLQTNATTEN